MAVLIGYINNFNNFIMKIFYFFFYVFFGTWAQYYHGERDYSYGNAILGGLTLSILLSLNILTILLILGCGNIIRILIDNLGLGCISFLLLPFIFVYFSCIHKKKYLEIRERFSYMDKNWKKRLLAVLIVFLYWMVSILLFTLSCAYYLK